MKSEIRTVTYSNGDLQRFQVVSWDSWQNIRFLEPAADPHALESFERIYRDFLVPACPWPFGNMVMFTLPEGMAVPFTREIRRWGCVADDLTAAAAALESGVRFSPGGSPRFRDKQTEEFYRALEERGCLRLVRGKLPVTAAIPVGNRCGLLSQSAPGAKARVNASFFIMDRFDCATAYDHVGTPLGLLVKDGVIRNPPLFRREALVVRRDGSVRVEIPDIRQLAVCIGGKIFRHGENCRIYTRPDTLRGPVGKRKKLVIIGNRVAGVTENSRPLLPASGFLLVPREDISVRPGEAVAYQGMEDAVFAIQVGNSILREGKPTERFVSAFYNIRRFEPVPFPPSLYPMDFRKSRAARIALGADGAGKPMVLWAEGAPKVGYTPGRDSCGASLFEMAELCALAGMVNAVNLDGGGSAQLLLGEKRCLGISDRKSDGTEAERPIPLALAVD